VRALSLLQVAGCALNGGGPLMGSADALPPGNAISVFRGRGGCGCELQSAAGVATAVAFTVQLWAQQFTSPGQMRRFCLRWIRCSAVITSSIVLGTNALSPRAMRARFGGLRDRVWRNCWERLRAGSHRAGV